MRNRKIRRLASPESGKISSKGNRSFILPICLFMLTVLVGIFLNCYPEFDVRSFLYSLHDNYEQQYNSIVQGNPEFCKQSLEIDKMFKEINREVLNQEKALTKIQSIFANNNNTVRGILVAGTPGVGKTLFGKFVFADLASESNANYEERQAQFYLIIICLLTSNSGCSCILYFNLRSIAKSSP